METREAAIKDSRTQIPGVNFSSSMSEEEYFQNNTIRPVVIFQKYLLVEVFRNYIRKYKNVFYDLNVENKLSYIENAIQKDMKFRNLLKGIIVGQFTVEEYFNYTTNSSALNKRIMSVVKEQLQANIQLFEGEAQT